MIRLVNCADIHLRRRNPLTRIDDFYSAVQSKVRWVVQQANEIDAHAITIAGDVFDTTHTSFEVMVDIHRIFQEFTGGLLAIYGQHDLRYHSYKGRKNTPLSALLATLKNQAPVCESPTTLIDNGVQVTVFGCSWGQDILPAPDVKGYKVLLLHRLVVEEGELWPGHTNFISANDLFKLGYDLVVSGDNHQSFAVEDKGRWVVNVGSLLRLKISQMEYAPRIAISTFSDKIDIEWKAIPINQDVFANIQESELLTVNDELFNFILSLREHRFQKPDFKRNLSDIVSRVEDKAISDMVDEVMERVAKQDDQGE